MKNILEFLNYMHKLIVEVGSLYIDNFIFDDIMLCGGLKEVKYDQYL